MLMKLKKKYALFAQLFCSLLFSPLSAAGQVELREGPQNLTVTFTLPELFNEQIEKDGEQFSIWTFHEAYYTDETGAPQLPIKTVLIGLPQGEFNYTVTAGPFEQQRSAAPLPVPHVYRDDEGLTAESFTKDAAIYRFSDPYPASPVKISAPMYFRDQRVVRIVFSPIQYLPGAGSVKIHRKLTASFQFPNSAASAERNQLNANDEALYKSAVRNYEQAKVWRKARSKSLEKKQQPASANWYKMGVSEHGVYKVTGAELSSAGIDPLSIDPHTLRLYNNGGEELPRDISESRPDSLLENPIIVVDGGDGSFGNDDYFLFYGKGVSGWRHDSGDSSWAHYINHYTDTNIYWLSWGGTGSGTRIETAPVTPLTGATEVTSFRDRIFYEEDLSNPFHGGFLWFGRKFDNTSQYRTYSIATPAAISADSAFLRFNFVAVSSGDQAFDVSLNELNLGDTSIRGASSSTYLAVNIKQSRFATAGQLVPGSNTIGVRFSGYSATSEGYMDWFEMEYSRALEASADELLLYAPGDDDALRYSVSGFSQNSVLILDVTSISEVSQIEPASVNSGTATFADFSQSETGKVYYLCTPAAYRTVDFILQAMPPDLRYAERNAELLIVTHDDFYAQAMQLKSLRETWNPARMVRTEVVKISEVFDAFSCGLYDATALRDFIKYAYENWDGPLLHVLLFGDGDFDFRNILSANDQNWIPTYQTTDTNETSSRTSDDWFVCVSGDDNLPDLSIGRMPVQTVSGARNVVDKLISYETQPHYGDWRNTITMVGDDDLTLGGVGDEAFHTRDTETIAETLLPKSFDVKKVYLVEYPAVRSPSISGVVKPAANQELLDQINRGTLLINFIGHGAPQLWTHERVLNSPSDFNKIQNGDKYGFWIAATCDFARFDDPYEQALSEDLLAAGGRGAIGLLSSARLAYSHQNATLNTNFLTKLFEKYKTGGSIRTIGEALWLSKLTGESINNQKYLILGDPSLLLAAPTYRAVIESIEPDSIQALGLMTVKGHIERDGALWSDFHGQVLLKTYDTRRARQYTTELGIGIQYILPGNIIFRGASEVNGGIFQASFIAPKDISYGGKEGRISTYFWNDQYDGIGYRDQIHIGGTGAAFVDNIGPEIEIGFAQRGFASGEYTSQDPVLHVEINDSTSGVNLAGDIGHKITMVLDGDSDNRRDLTEFFNYHTGSYTSGSLDYQLTGLNEGAHTIEMKAWDNSNNSSEAFVEFQVVSSEHLVLSEVLNYPNPMSNYTDFTFEISRDAEVTIKIYTLAGRLVKSFTLAAMANFNSLRWDGRDEEGDKLSNGVYLYRVIATASGIDGVAKTETINKLMIMN